MSVPSRHNVLGVMIDAVDYQEAVHSIMRAANLGAPFSVTALAVHGVMTGHQDPDQRFRLNHFDLVVPDGQPVRWALNLLHGAGLKDRVYGPNLMLRICAAAARDNLPIYLYGSKPGVLTALKANLQLKFPTLRIAGAEPSRFRTLNEQEKAETIDRIRESGARLVFVGLGCPRQEVWAYEYRDQLSMPVIAVGAAFDFHAGNLAQAPAWMQKRGLEWLFRLRTEPRRLWRRYLILNPWYASLLLLQWTRMRKFPVERRASFAPPDISYG